MKTNVLFNMIQYFIVSKYSQEQQIESENKLKLRLVISVDKFVTWVPQKMLIPNRTKALMKNLGLLFFAIKIISITSCRSKHEFYFRVLLFLIITLLYEKQHLSS